MPIYRPAISMDRPDVFNSVALPIGRTSLDRRWRKVANGPVGTASGAYAAKPAKVFRFEEIADAHRLMESNQANGKIVVTV